MLTTVLACLATLLVLGAVLWPLLRPGHRTDQGAFAEIAVYKAQLDELVREREQGLIGPEEAAAAKIEIERRLLVVARRAERETRAQAGGRRPWTATLTGLAILVITVSIYAALGNPGMRDRPLAQREAERAAEQETMQAQAGDLRGRVADLEARLEENPDDADQWWLLAQTYNAIGRYDQAAQALQEVLRLSGNAPGLLGAYGEALVRANANDVTGPARLAFQQALDMRPEDPRARYYLALGEAQDGNYEVALERWLSLYNDSLPEAPWRPIVEEHLVEMARLTGRDVTEVLPETSMPSAFEAMITEANRQMAAGDEAAARATLAAAEERFAGAPFVLMQIRQAAAQLGLTPPAPQRGPSPDDVAAASELSEAEQLQMIRGMVGGLADRLENEPDDLEGWLMLMRSYVVLGNRSEAEAAMQSARAAFEGNAEALNVIDTAAERLGLEAS